MTSISVAMATYNGERYLMDQLSSIRSQTLQPDELVICDDGSSDGTCEIVNSFARTVDFRVSFLVNESRLNYADNFLRAVSLCQSDFVAFCDQDDLWAPEKLATMRKAFQASDAVLVVHAAESFNESEGRLGSVDPGARGLRDGLSLVPFGFFLGFTMMVRRSIVEAYAHEKRPRDLWEPQLSLAHDRWVCFLASVLGSVFVLDEELARYRQHGSNASGWMRAKKSWNKLFEAGRRRYGYDLARHYVAASELREVALDLSASHSVSPEILLRWAQSVDSFRRRMEVATLDSRLRRVFRILSLVTQGEYRRELVGRPTFITARDLALALTCRKNQGELVREVFAGTPSWSLLERYWGR